jgi:hypothetical protein
LLTLNIFWKLQISPYFWVTFHHNKVLH